jgi:hypothetical protein
MTTTATTTARTDELGRTWVTVDTATAERLLAWREATWTEIHGVGYGHTATAEPGTEIFDLLATIHDACVAAGDENAFIAADEYLDARLAGEQPSTRLLSTCGVSGYRKYGYYLGG